MKSEVLDSLFKLYDSRSRQCDSITFYKQERDPLFGILSQLFSQGGEREEGLDQSTMWPTSLLPAI